MQGVWPNCSHGASSSLHVRRKSGKSGSYIEASLPYRTRTTTMHAGVDPRPAQNTRGSFSTPMSPSTSSTMATTSKSSASGLANTHMHATHSHTTSNIETRDCGRKRKVQNTGWDPDPQQEHPQVHQHGTSVTIDSPGQDEPTGEDSKRIKLAAATAGEKRLRRSVPIFNTFCALVPPQPLQNLLCLP